MKIYSILLFITLLISKGSISQIKIDQISSSSLHIWSVDEFYIFEFYLENKCNDEGIRFEIKSKNEHTILKVGIDNIQVDSLDFGLKVCKDEKQLIRVLFKNIAGEKKTDTIEVLLANSVDTLIFDFQYKVEKNNWKEVKIFQSNFTKYLILDAAYGSVKELILYDENRMNFEHIKSRSRFLDLSFLENGKYILEIDNEEYFINKH